MSPYYNNLDENLVSSKNRPWILEKPTSEDIDDAWELPPEVGPRSSTIYGDIPSQQHQAQPHPTPLQDPHSMSRLSPNGPPPRMHSNSPLLQTCSPVLGGSSPLLGASSPLLGNNSPASGVFAHQQVHSQPTGRPSPNRQPDMVPGQMHHMMSSPGVPLTVAQQEDWSRAWNQHQDQLRLFQFQQQLQQRGVVNPMQPMLYNPADYSNLFNHNPNPHLFSNRSSPSTRTNLNFGMSHTLPLNFGYPQAGSQSLNRNGSGGRRSQSNRQDPHNWHNLMAQNPMGAPGAHGVMIPRPMVAPLLYHPEHPQQPLPPSYRGPPVSGLVTSMLHDTMHHPPLEDATLVSLSEAPKNPASPQDFYEDQPKKRKSPGNDGQPSPSSTRSSPADYIDADNQYETFTKGETLFWNDKGSDQWQEVVIISNLCPKRKSYYVSLNGVRMEASPCDLKRPEAMQAPKKRKVDALVTDRKALQNTFLECYYFPKSGGQSSLKKATVRWVAPNELSVVVGKARPISIQESMANFCKRSRDILPGMDNLLLVTDGGFSEFYPIYAKDKVDIGVPPTSKTCADLQSEFYQGSAQIIGKNQPQRGTDACVNVLEIGCGGRMSWLVSVGELMGKGKYFGIECNNKLYQQAAEFIQHAQLYNKYSFASRMAVIKHTFDDILDHELDARIKARSVDVLLCDWAASFNKSDGLLFGALRARDYFLRKKAQIYPQKFVANIHPVHKAPPPNLNSKIVQPTEQAFCYFCQGGVPEDCFIDDTEGGCPSFNVGDVDLRACSLTDFVIRSEVQLGPVNRNTTMCGFVISFDSQIDDLTFAGKSSGNSCFIGFPHNSVMSSEVSSPFSLDALGGIDLVLGEVLNLDVLIYPVTNGVRSPDPPSSSPCDALTLDLSGISTTGHSDPSEFKVNFGVEIYIPSRGLHFTWNLAEEKWKTTHNGVVRSPFRDTPSIFSDAVSNE